MKFFYYGKDGGKESTVEGWWLVEIKGLFSIVLLKFNGDSREVFHTHAFNCLSWVIRGTLYETYIYGKEVIHKKSFKPFFTYRDTFHKVDADNPTYVFSIRGCWKPFWEEYLPKENRIVTLRSGRREVSSYDYL